jgi:hypothetical protein
MVRRSYTLGRYPAVVVLGSGMDELDSVAAFEHHVAGALGVELQVRARNGCLLLPGPDEVYKDGRELNGEEQEAYAAASFAAAERFGAAEVRCFTDHLYIFDWRTFDRAAHDVLEAAYMSLPGWQGFDRGRPRWFGADEDVGPSLYASMEPPGLQVSGVLELKALRRWHRAFLRATRPLPSCSR